MIGNPATTAINKAPIKVILPITVLIYCFVSFPGLTPGIYPPCLDKFLDNSLGFTWINVYKKLNANINTIYAANPVGVVLETYNQLESSLLNRNYKGGR